VPIEKQKGAECLILGGSGDLALDGKKGEEGFDLGSAHVLGMTHVVEEDEAPNPLQVLLLGAVGVVLDAESFLNARAELGRIGVCHGRRVSASV